MFIYLKAIVQVEYGLVTEVGKLMTCLVPELFEQEANRVRSVLENKIIQLEHVDSTSDCV